MSWHAEQVYTHGQAPDELTQAIVEYSVARTRLDDPPLDHALSPRELDERVGQTITPAGIGGMEAFRLFTEILAPACISVDNPRFLSFIPAAPTEASLLFDMLVGASSVYAGSWMEGSGAVYAENQALRWVADLAGLPAGAGGVFVSGGTVGNLSALIAARHQWRALGQGMHDTTRPLIAASKGAHSSVTSAARVLDADVLRVPADDRGRMNGAALRGAIDGLTAADRARLCAVVTTAGTTNIGVVDDLAGAADVAEALGVWFHVDGAYGGAGLAVPSMRHLYRGVERADSFIVDPHKWLFAPFDCCALVYRDPPVAKAAHTQYAEYLDVLTDSDEWNPSDYAHHLSRRARGLPFWFSLATYGTDAYAQAIEQTLDMTRQAARLIEKQKHLQLLHEPELSIVMFRRLGWTPQQYADWSNTLLYDGLAFVVPSSWEGETVLRFCFVNPLTTIDDVQAILDTLAA
jgi:L-2,4-diaminobutyrate decarboxylase